MWIVWVLIGLGNLAMVAACMYVFGRRESDASGASPATRDAFRSLQTVTGEVSRRVEDNANRLDAVVQKLTELPTETLSSLKGSVKEQSDFAAYLRRSNHSIKKHGARLGLAGEPSGSGTGGSSGPRDAFVGDAVAAAIAAAGPNDGNNQRREDRESMSFTMCVLPLDGEFNPAGTPFVAVARDISTGGMSFSHTGSLTSPYVGVWMTLAGVQDICLVMDRRHTSRLGPITITGGEFVRRLENGPLRETLLDFASSAEMTPVREPVPGRQPAQRS